MPAKPLPGPSRLSGILKSLNRPPRPAFPSLKALKLSLAAKDGDFGARQFLKEDVPRIRFANQDLNIGINSYSDAEALSRKAELALEFKDGKSQKIDMSLKLSSTIFEELMDAAGGDRWQRYKEERAANGEAPVVRTVKSRTLQAASHDRQGVAAALP